MTTLEHYASNAPSHLLAALDFDRLPVASYCTARRVAYTHASGASDYTYKGVRHVTFKISGDGWLDISNTCFVFRLRNSSSKAMTTRGDPSLFVERMIVKLGNCIVEDIDNYNRVDSMFKHMTPYASRTAQEIEGFGLAPSSTDVDLWRNMDTWIKPHSTFTFAFRPRVSGLWNCGKYLSLRWAPVVVELSLSPDIDCMGYYVEEDGTVDTAGGIGSYLFDEIYIRHPIITLKDSLHDSYYEALLRNEALTISMPHIQCTPHTLTASDGAIVLTRGFSRLNAVFVVFGWNGGLGARPDVFPYPKGDYVRAFDGNREGLSDDMALKWQFAIQTRFFPERMVDTLQETWAAFLEAVNLHGQDLKAPSITGYDYCSNVFILGQSLMKSPGTWASGLNTASGDCLRLEYRGLELTRANICWVITLSDCVVEIAEAGVKYIS